ncbi:MAG TPA: PSD1 and planctomycete cytochrome C domain-containing protein [Planctomycetota bacterium]|nr:PSD1 and planctomycete cytochrome C domain-containing protein [Planctomycetota bacterium]
MRRTPSLAGVALLLLLSLPARSQDDAATRDGLDFFEKRIRPVLVDKCYSCHSAGAEKIKGNLVVDTREGLLKGGDTGPSILPGNPDKSLLIKAMKWTEEDFKMPPKKRLPKEVVADFETWIRKGALDPRISNAPVAKKPAINVAEARHAWPFTPLVEPAAPPLIDASWAWTPIDRYLLSKLQAKRLKPAPDADKRTLIRRATFDLTGLPPTPEEIDAFLADRSDAAFSRVVERLLNSPAYGERWGRHWLDLVRYADTAGDNSDFPIPQIYKYRNYVIKAFNDDKPYDQFIREQLAGDLLPFKTDEERHENLIATGYLANAKRFGSVEDNYPWHLTIEDTIDNLGRTFLGLTVNCTRCHDHKFDPLTNEDYYALYGIFESTRYPWPGIELVQYQKNFIPLAPPAVVEKVEKERAEKQAELNATLKELEAEKKHYEAAVHDAMDAEADRIKELVSDLSRRIDGLRKGTGSSLKQPLPYETAYAVCEAPHQGNSKVQIKGDPTRLGREVPRRFIEVLGGQALSSESKGSGRYQLADWMADPANPLTARVMANRLWHYHFGKGIIQTPSDFGRQGRPPTHPELLDWLARRFIDSGWSIKAMHRLILSTHAYRMSCDGDAGAIEDPANDLLWKFRRRRLEAEAIRDSLLAVSGALDRRMGGPHPFPPMPSWDFTQHKPFIAVYENSQRSVYLMSQRIRRHPYFGTFDGAETNMSTALRITSTTPLQALWMLNDPFVHEQARAFAARLLKERNTDATRIERAYALTLGRAPTSEEAATSLDYVSSTRAQLDEQQAWESFARILFRLNEFVYVR